VKIYLTAVPILTALLKFDTSTMLKFTSILCSQIIFLGVVVSPDSSADSNNESSGDLKSHVVGTMERYPPCINMHNNCEASDCRKPETRDYMRDHCRLTCNYCNPLLRPLKLHHNIENTNEIFHGVTQKVDFETSSMVALDKEQAKIDLKQRIQLVLDSQDFYFKMYYASSHNSDNESSDRLLPIPETCINRHPYCAH